MDTDPGMIALKKSPFPQVSSRELAEQIDSKARTARKLPLWHDTPGIYFPPRLSIEQTSSEATAEYKRSLITPGRLIDLTGGFGVDSYYFSKSADVWHLEINSGLSEISRHNAAVLGAFNITYIREDGIAYLRSGPGHFDTIYADPSRRVKTRKVFRLSDCEPDVVANLPLLLSMGSRVIIKTAPLLDIRMGLEELQHVREIHVLSVKNDCKELLWIMEDGYTGDPLIVCAALNTPTQVFSYRFTEERDMKLSRFAAPGTFIYEPDVALLKAGCFKLITRAFGVEKLHINTHLYTSENLAGDFIGRKFRLLERWSYKAFQAARPVSRASVICRNFPQSPDEVKKKHKIQDGGDSYLLFTTGPQDDLLVLHCERL
ncbi:MAG TPA: class I SAM-dependent methyltransferase [Sphingobacteriaceae bacterium]